ncbi:MAG: 3-isopropylmalate dehydrogenase [Lachnospiraceae bacterium]|nr:3-isopropylmalate dehydrogenase [Lachnospiraceae bacterium]
MKDTFLQWHPAFYADIQIDFTEEKEKLIFENEHQLGTKPKSIDVLIVKKSKETKIQKNIGRIFRSHNLIEYKSPKDYLGVDDFYKVYGYACFYKADGNGEDTIKADDITITLVSKVCPSKLLQHLEEVRGYRIKAIMAGIYYVYGDHFPIQIIVIKELSKEENFWLRYLTDDISSFEEVQEIMDQYELHRHEKLYKSVIELIVSANKEIFREVREMREIVRILYDEELEEARVKAMEEGVAEGRAEGIAKGRAEGIAEGMLAGKTEGKLFVLQEFVNDGIISMEQAAERFGVAVTRLEELFAGLEKV